MAAEPEEEKAEAGPAAEARAPMLAPLSDGAAPQAEQPEGGGHSRLGMISVAILAAGVATGVVFRNEIMEAPLFSAPGATQSETTDLSQVRFDVTETRTERRTAEAAPAAQVRGKIANYKAACPTDDPTLFELVQLPAALGGAAAAYKASPAAHGTFSPEASPQTVQLIGTSEGQYVYEVTNKSAKKWNGFLTFPSTGETWVVEIPAGGTVRLQTASVIDDFHPLVGYLGAGKKALGVRTH